MKDIGGVPLKSVIPMTGFKINDFLDIAIHIGNECHFYNYDNNITLNYFNNI